MRIKDLYWLENEILLNVQTKVTRLYTRIEERNYRSWLLEENKLNTYTSIIHLSLCSFGIRSIIAIACPVNRLRAIEITFDHCWALYSACDFSFIEFFLHKEGDTRSSASDTYVYLKLTIVHFWRIWFHERRHARQVRSHVMLCPTRNISDEICCSHSGRLADDFVSQLTKVIYAPGR